MTSGAFYKALVRRKNGMKQAARRFIRQTAIFLDFLKKFCNIHTGNYPDIIAAIERRTERVQWKVL
jgi:hypothetical protein